MRAVWGLLLCLALQCQAQEDKIPVYIRDDVYADYLTFLAGRAPDAINDFSGPGMRRDVADLVLLQQALLLGGFKRQFQYLPGKINFRNTSMLKNGDSLLSFDTYWLSDAEKFAGQVYITEPIIAKGDYLAGVFASPANEKVFQLRSLEQLRQLTAVSTPKWHTDWATLSALPLKQLFRQDEWLSQARMVHLQWADFMLMPFFPNENQSFILEKIELKAVPGIAVLLNDSRHFVISRKHPEGAAAFAALNLGLQQMKRQGTINRLYRQAGFLVDKKQVHILNPP
ncbi:hypothetical protein [Rheinheimera sp.]|uniref:hypothetical protein n=1 Tax=Rheinheimera sp. TaxID=1869214 RepID=UPI00307CFE96